MNGRERKYKRTYEFVVNLVERKINLVLDTKYRLPVGVMVPGVWLKHVQPPTQISDRTEEAAVVDTHGAAVVIQITLGTLPLARHALTSPVLWYC